MKNRDIGFVICTSTLAQGVNLPIRYLIVTGVYQGAERITVRDFHNLLGRTGRIDQHTEGSVIIADPDVYDMRRVYRENWRWKQYKELLNPDNSEPCASSLLSIFDPPVEAIDLVSAYMHSEERLKEFTEEILSTQFHGFDREGLRRQIDFKIGIISSIENYLMARWDEAKPELENEDVVLLVSETLAYFLADEEKKEQLIEIFLMLEHNIEQNISEAPKRKIFGRTMYGVRSSMKIESWVNQHIEELVKWDEQDELLKNIWPILAENIQNNTFRKCDSPDKLRDIALGWISGQTYDELFRIASTADVRIIAGTRRRHIKLDSIIDICDNGLSYDGTLVIGAITEIMALLRPEDSAETIVRLLELQKRLKYGLSTTISIILYELGFSDRVVSMDLASILKNTPLDRSSIIRYIKQDEHRVRELLEKYPSYFMERLNNLL